MSRVAVVAWNTFREAVRDRVLYNLVFFCAGNDGGGPFWWVRSPSASNSW